MHLKGFHIVFILASLGLSLIMAAWCLQGWRVSGSTGMLVGGVAAFGAGVGLASYGFWFVKKMRRLR